MDMERLERYACTLSCYRHLFGQEPCRLAWETVEEAANQQ